MSRERKRIFQTFLRQRNVLVVVRHFEQACEQPAGRERGRGKETRRNGQGYRFPNAGDLCRVQTNYSGRKHNHTE